MNTGLESPVNDVLGGVHRDNEVRHAQLPSRRFGCAGGWTRFEVFIFMGVSEVSGRHSVTRAPASGSPRPARRLPQAKPAVRSNGKSGFAS